MITLDVVMPRLDGFEHRCERLRADPRTAGIPVVMVTGRAQAADRARGEALGVDAYSPSRSSPPSWSSRRRLALAGTGR